MNHYFIRNILIFRYSITLQHHIFIIIFKLPTQIIKPNLDSPFINHIIISYHNPVNFIIICCYMNTNITSVEFPFQNIAIIGRTSKTFFFQFTNHLGFGAIDRNTQKTGHIFLRPCGD